MLQVLQGGNISDALVVATRYFGGTKLGIGGLTRAYRDCARLPLAETVLVTREPLSAILLTMRYEDLGAVSRLLETFSGTVDSVEYSASVTMQIQLPARSSEEFINSFESSCRGQGTWKMR
jgi:putative IMPACT (imprinted ancient) family translation regulator